MSKKITATGPELVPADQVPSWSSGWSTGLPVVVSFAGDAIEHAVAAGAPIPASIVHEMRTAAHVSGWTNEARAIGDQAEARWRAQAMQAARDLEPLPALDDLVLAKSARDTDDLLAGILSNFTKEAIGAAFRAVKANAEDLIAYGLAPTFTDVIDQLEDIATRVPVIVVDEVAAFRAGNEVSDAWRDAMDASARYWSLVRSRAALQHAIGLDTRDPERLALVGRRVDARALKSEPAHPVACALHRARARRDLELWMPTPVEYRELLEVKAAAA